MTLDQKKEFDYLRQECMALQSHVSKAEQELCRLRQQMATLVAEFKIGDVLIYGQGHRQHRGRVIRIKGDRYNPEKVDYIVQWFKKDGTLALGEHVVYAFDKPQRWKEDKHEDTH